MGTNCTTPKHQVIILFMCVACDCRVKLIHCWSGCTVLIIGFCLSLAKSCNDQLAYIKGVLVLVMSADAMGKLS